VGYLFNHVGFLYYPAGSNEDRIMEAAIEAGAEDVVVDADKSIEVLTDPGEFESIRDAMRAAGLDPESSELTMRASMSSELDIDTAGSMVKMLEMLEDLDDVQNVYSNAEISDEILAQL
jgi:transcriptional/translational regulatory protein YebC/TACO1